MKKTDHETTIDELKTLVVKFRQERGWEKHFTPKNVATSIAIEAAELLEHFQWKNMDESRAYLESHKDELSKEVADIAIYLLYFCDEAGIDLFEAINSKMDVNEQKYPVDKSKGNSKKYNELD